jgi:hypothetical protein
MASRGQAGFLLGIFDPEDGGDMLTFNGLHGVISQKIVLFITTAVRTSDPTLQQWFLRQHSG